MSIARGSRLTRWADEPDNRRKVLLATVAGAVLLAVVLEILMRQSWMQWLRHVIQRSGFVGDVFFPATQPQWKDKLTALLPIIGLPIAFWLWHWRDKNVRDQIAEQRNQVANQSREIENQALQIEVQKEQVGNQSKEIEISRENLKYLSAQIDTQRRELILKDFLEVQRHAAGLFSQEGSESAKIQLQISAMHQLRAFLAKEYPGTIRRAAFELLLAGDADSMRELGVGEWGEEIPIPTQIRAWKGRLTPVMSERIAIIQTSIPQIISDEFPVRGRRLDLIDFSEQSFQNGSEIRKCSLIGCNFYRCNLVGLSFWDSDFSGSDLWHGNYEDCSFWDADLRHCDLSEATFTRVEFRYTNLASADLRKAKFLDCEIIDSRGVTTLDAKDASFSSGCKFFDSYEQPTESEISERKTIFARMGANLDI